MQYATLTDLVQRVGGDEVVQRGLSGLRVRYRQAVSNAPDLGDAIADPRPDDVALVEADGLLYVYSGQSWSSLATPKITQALQDASALADTHLRVRYALPLAGTPRALVLAVCDIARYYLYEDAVTNTVQSRYDQAISWLKQVASGSVSLDGVEAAQAESGRGSAVLTGPGRVFSRDSLGDF